MTSANRKYLVTAGSTRELIDSVRDWGNIFTGQTGFEIALALSAAGEVDLLTSNPAHLAGSRAIHPVAFTTHADLKRVLRERMAQQKYDAVLMTAAVADYRPAGVYEIVERKSAGEGEQWIVRSVQAGKVSSRFDRIAVAGEPTEKLVDLFRTEWKHKGLLVKFKLEVGISANQLIAIGQASRIASGADYLVANTLNMARGLNGQKAGAYLLGEAGVEWIERTDLPARMASLANAAGGL